MPRVYHLIKGLGRGGAETLLVETRRFADPRRYEYAYGYFLPWKSAFVDALRQQGATVECFDRSSSASILLAARRVALSLRRWEADLVHCHLPMAGVVGRLAGRLAGVPVVYTEHNRLERYHPLTRRANVLSWNLHDLAIAVSDEVRTSIESHVRSKRPTKVILNGVDTDHFDLARCEPSRIREDLGIPAGSPVVGTVAVFRSQKRLQDWLEAARMLRATAPDVHFLIVGDGPLRAELLERAGAAGLDGSIHFPGLQVDVRPYLALMDVFLISSEFEGLPVALLEAMSMQRTVVSTDVGGIPEVVRNGENGILVAPRDPYALFKAVGETLDRRGHGARMGIEARSTVIERFGLRRMTTELEDAYDEVLAGRRE